MTEKRRRLLIATTNAGKTREIGEILAGTPIDLVTLAGWPGVAAPDETGRTFEENARQKALYAAATGDSPSPRIPVSDRRWMACRHESTHSAA